MAVLKNITLAALLLAPFTMAAPRLDARAMYTHTDTEIVWVTVEETTTIWLEPGAPTPAPAPVAAADTTTVAVANSSATSGPAVFAAQTIYGPSTTMATVAGAAAAPAAPPASSPAAAAWSSAPAPAPVAPAPASPAPAAESSPAAASAASAPAPSASSSNGGGSPKDISASQSATCEGTGAACVGDVTHWDGGKFVLHPLCWFDAVR